MPCDLLDASRDDLAALAVRYGGRPFAGAQLYEWLYRRGETDVARMTNLPRAFRETLARETVATRLAVIDEQAAADGTRKFLFRLPAGEAVETVLIAMGDERRTLCISTQVGCAMGCRFCRTATMGFVRNLRQAEILAQVLTVRRHVPFTNIVLMGMGEPLHNYDAVVAALRILIDPKGLGFSKRHVTLSTVGLAPAIRRLADEGLGIKLALSLHATTDAQRAALIPVARRYPLAEVIEACRVYCAAAGPRHRVTFEYLLIKGINDNAADVTRLVGIASHLPSKVNVIPVNPFPGSPWERPTEADVERFCDRLRAKHVQVNVRISRGREILAACGQLATQSRSA